MAKKTTRLDTGAAHVSDLARTVAQIGSAQDLAKQISAATGAVRAADLAKAVMQIGSVRYLAESPKINLNLPDISRTLQASLPRPLPDSYLLPREERAVPTNEIVHRQDINLPEVDLPELEIASSEDLGLLIRRVRKKRKLSQQKFADLAGVGRRFVSELENGKATLELSKVLKAAHAAGISVFARGR